MLKSKIITALILSQLATSNMVIKKVSYLVRNGPDNPNTHFYSELSFMTPNQKNTLTQAGTRMMFNLGSFIHKKYPELTNSEKRVFSSEKQNAKMSAFAIFNGIKGANFGKKISSSKTILPPFEGQNYQFTNESALPHNWDVPIISAFEDEEEPLFEQDLREECPLIFDAYANNLSMPIEFPEGTKKLEDYDLEFEKLRDDLQKANIQPKGSRADKGWDPVNLQEFFDVAESHYYNTKSHFPGLTEEVYNKLWLYKSFATEVNFFDRFYKLSHVWTNNIMNSTLKFFKVEHEEDHAHEEEEENMRVYVTDGLQFYAFLRLMRFSSTNCLLSVNNGTLEYPFPIGTKKTHKGDHSCYFYPRYGASLTFELAKNTQDGLHYVRVLFNDDTLDMGCPNQTQDFYCELTSFSNHLFYTLFGFEYLKLCKTREIPIFEDITQHKTERNALKYIMYGSILAAVIVFVLFVYCKYRNDKSNKEDIQSKMEEINKKEGGIQRRVELRKNQEENKIKNGIEFDPNVQFSDKDEVDTKQKKSEVVDLSFDDESAGNKGDKGEYELDNI